jgi:hypothetical protein
VAGDPVRDEAERLVAAAIAAVSMAARGLGASVGSSGPRVATGSAECCVCPVCKVIAALREPDDDLVDRLTAGAGDLAVAVAALLRSFSGTGTAPAGDSHDDRPGGDPWRSAATEDQWRSAATEDPWRSATTRPDPAASAAGPSEPPRPTKPVAKKAVKKAVPPKARPATDGTSAPVSRPAPDGDA